MCTSKSQTMPHYVAELTVLLFPEVKLEGSLTGLRAWPIQNRYNLMSTPNVSTF